MTGRIYALFAIAAVDTSSAAVVIVQRDCIITGVNWAIRVTATTAGGANVLWQLSISSTLQTANDSTGVISEVCSGGMINTSGAHACENHQHSNLSIPIIEGSRLYLHADATTANTTSANCLVHVLER